MTKFCYVCLPQFKKKKPTRHLKKAIKIKDQNKGSKEVRRYTKKCNIFRNIKGNTASMKHKIYNKH